MENLHSFEKEGCRMDGLVKVERKNLWREPEEINGIRFTVC